MQRKINGLLVLFSLLGGALGFVLGEILLHQLEGKTPHILNIGLYFGVLALCIGLGCLLAEMISPKLNGASWRQMYMGTSWKLWIPATLVLLLVVGAALEFLYEVDMGSQRQVRNIVFVIDNSGSMQQTDPDNARYAAAKSLIGQMDSAKQVSVVAFGNEAEVIQPFVKVSDQDAKLAIYEKIDSLAPTDDGTNIEGALNQAMQLIREESTKGTLVILLSDGVSDVNVDKTLRDYIDQHIAIHTVGLSLVDPSGTQLLETIANRTNGQYYDVEEAKDISLVFQQIYNTVGDRTLLTERTGSLEGSSLYMIMRILAITIIGAAIGIALGIVFDNRYLAKSFAIGGAAAGLLAGCVLEFGLSGSTWLDGIVRLIAALILALVTTLFTLIVPIQEHGARSYSRSSRPVRTDAGQAFDQPKSDRTSRGFNK
ncbi:vWA domain-containing protein [Paenibacillus sp. 1001270B_150601_E10]|uniref:vWA domain-containing protein n=1 Tax=Paenibacillus sp. 1001270B_150601_E10 TaxID=2787079 RepID=UPI00189E65A5|nr:VWA domain-containing protein [Paenibacillus sp. 1001270B_150601_E10]